MKNLAVERMNSRVDRENMWSGFLPILPISTAKKGGENDLAV